MKAPRVEIWVVLACVLVLLCVGTGKAQAAAWWTPPQQLTWYWQLSGAAPAEPTDAVDSDGFDTSAATVAALHARGQRAICYIDAGTYEDWRPDASSFPSSVKGSAVSGWPGENWLDISQLGVLEPIMTARFQMCAGKGFDAVEPDNIDGYENNTGVTAAQQLAYNEWIATEVHALGMAVFQKNDPDQAGQLQPYFDGELDEECNKYSECSAFQPYLAAGKPVLDAEYTDDGETTAAFCGEDQAAGIMGALYSINLDGSYYAPCFAASTLSGPITGGPFTGTNPVSPGTTTVSGTTSPNPTPTGARHGQRAKVDGRPPRVKLVGKVVRAARRVVSLSLRCPADQSYCAGTLRLSTVPAARGASAHRARSTGKVFSTRHFHIRGGHVVRLRVRWRSSVLHRLARRRPLPVLVTADAHDRAGHHAHVAWRLTLRARHSR